MPIDIAHLTFHKYYGSAISCNGGDGDNGKRWSSAVDRSVTMIRVDGVSGMASARMRLISLLFINCL